MELYKTKKFLQKEKKEATTQRDGMGREEGGGFRMGNTCIPVVDSFFYFLKEKFKK